LKEDKINIVALGLDEGVRNILKKYFLKSEFLFINFNLTFEERLKGDFAYDCLLVYSDIEQSVIKKIKDDFSAIHILYLPSLNIKRVEYINSEDKLISEPFKLSELEKRLKDIYERKAANRN